MIVHAAAHGVDRPLVTDDADILVDIRELSTRVVSRWLEEHGFELEGVSADGIGHRFRRGAVAIDVLAIDHTPGTDRTTVPPARTVEVPGGRRAINRLTSAMVTTADGHTGLIPMPDWLGAVLLKARAATGFADERQKHLQDLALLLSLPHSAGPHAGDTALWRSSIDDHTLIVGYATGPAAPVATEVVQTDTAVTVTLVFKRPNLPPPSDDDTFVGVTPVLNLGRVIVTLDAPLAGRPVMTAMRMQTPG